MKPIRVAHVITSLQTGGAEMMLAKLVASWDAQACQSLVICLGLEGALGQRIRDANVPVVSMGVAGARIHVSQLRRVIDLLKRWRPDILQGWMYHGNIAASLARHTACRNALVAWNIRCSLADLGDFPFVTRSLIRMSSFLSRNPARIIFNSRLAMEQHLSYGFDTSRSVVLPNGFDLSRFRPDLQVRSRVRERLGLRSNEIAIGMIARFHPMKDYPLFLRAAHRLASAHDKLRFVIGGPGVDPDSDELAREISNVGMQERVIVLGEVADTADVLPALDIFCLSSWTESFPNVIGEAMACGVPCVATSVGDVPELIGDTGRIVPVRNVEALTDALAAVASIPASERYALGQTARERIAKSFSLDEIAGRYLSTYSEMCV